MVRLILADSHAEVRKQLAERLSREPGLEILGQVSTAAEMVERVHAMQPDVLLIDPQAKGEDFMPGLKNLRFHFPNLRIVVLASVADTFLQVELRRIGIDRILNKGVRTERLLFEIGSPNFSP